MSKLKVVRTIKGNKQLNENNPFNEVQYNNFIKKINNSEKLEDEIYQTNLDKKIPTNETPQINKNINNSKTNNQRILSKGKIKTKGKIKKVLLIKKSNRNIK